MNKKNILGIVGIFVLIIIVALTVMLNKDKEIDTIKIYATVLSTTEETLTVQDTNNVIYTFYKENLEIASGDYVVIEYSGILEDGRLIQQGNIIDYDVIEHKKDVNGMPEDYDDDGIFSDYYVLAYNKLKEMSLDEKIGQILLVRYPDSNAEEILKKYKFGGYLFFEKDFKNKTKDQVINMMNGLNKVANIPILTAVDEEGGRVVRVSSNPNLAKEKFKSPKELYDEGGLNLIKQDTIEKSKLLKSLGINLNLAPVVDVSTDPKDYMYNRTIGENSSITSDYARTVISASKGTGVSYTLKHFPGYGNNADTHTGTSVDTRLYTDIQKNDLPPFQAGIAAGAEAILVSHNVVNSIDQNNPASLSSSIHNLLRDELSYTGIIMTDDISMDALDEIDNTTVKAILAGNDLIITTDYEKSISEIKKAIEEETISEETLNKLVFRVLAWKYYKGLMLETK